MSIENALIPYQRMAAYRIGDTCLTDLINYKGLSQCSGETIDQLKAQGNSIMPLDHAINLLWAVQNMAYVTPWIEITDEQYNEALNCLPPEKWEIWAPLEIFRMSEYYTSNITSYYVHARFSGRCFTARRRTSTPYATIRDEIMQIIAKSGGF